MSQGYLALVLHAHLPYVRHPEYEDFLEEDWFYEAVTETYIPLLWLFEGLQRDGVDFRITMSLSPTLCSMLLDPLLQDRYVNHLNKLLELTWKEIKRTQQEPQFQRLAEFYHQRLLAARHTFVEVHKKNLVAAFRAVQDAGKLEIITCGATHGFLPLMQETPQNIRAQILVARDHYRACFGREPRGIWLPECAYFPGLEDYLAEAEIRFLLLDTHGIMFAEPRPRYGVYAPLFTPSGVAAFGRDPESSKQVWSAEEGYPGDFVYRDFYRDVGFDREFDYIKPYIQPTGHRCFTGIKYFKITGRTHHKQPYDRECALDKAAQHAGNFMFNRERQIEHLRGALGREPIIVAPYDAELFGHWWFEGPDWLNYLIRKIAYDQKVFRLTTPSEYLRNHPTQQIAQPSASSWGNQGYWEVWLEGSNAWIYPHLHVAAQRMTELARQYNPQQQIPPLTERALKQAARELLLAQASDWAFIMKTGTAVSYAIQRTKSHILRFTRLYEQIKSQCLDQRWLASIEAKDNIFPDVNWRYWI